MAEKKETGETFEDDEMFADPGRRRIYDIVHPHSFMIPIIYFILCHLMEMSHGAKAFKMGLYLSGFVAMMLVIFSPILVWWNLSTAPVVIPAVVVLGLAFCIMVSVPTWQMWFPGRKAEA